MGRQVGRQMRRWVKTRTTLEFITDPKSGA